MAIQLTATALKRLKQGFGSIITSKKTHLPVLSSILLEPTEGGVAATATNLEETITFQLEGTIAAPVLFPWEDFKSLATRVGSKGEVRISTNEVDIGVEIHGEGIPMCYRITSENPSEFPEQPKLTYLETVGFAGDGFVVALRRAVVAASTDATRYVLNSVLYDGPAERIVGTDGRRLVCAGLPRCDSKMQMILPATKFLRRSPLLKQNITLEIDEKHCRMQSDDWAYAVKLVDGTYPNYKQVVPDDAKLQIVVDVCEDAKTNLAVLAALPKSEEVVLYADDTRALLVSPDGHGGFVHAALPYARCRNADDEIMVGFNPGFLKDALAAGFHQIRIQDAMTPTKFSSADGDFCILMPLRNTNAKPIQAYITKVLADMSAEPADVPVIPAPQPETKVVIPMTEATENTAEVEEQDPLDQLLNKLAETRSDLRVISQALRQVQALAKDVDRARKKEQREHQAVVDIVGRLKNLAA